MVERFIVLRYIEKPRIFIRTKSGLNFTGQIQNVWAEDLDLKDKFGKIVPINIDSIEVIDEDKKVN